MAACFIDTETTDIEKDAQPIEVAITTAMAGPLANDFVIERHLYKPTKPISFGARATHHILDADLEGAPTWPGKIELPAGVTYIVGHNVDFDWRVVGSPSVKRICTLALARHMYPSSDSHTLGACIYNIYPQAMARDLLKNAHSAAADVENCARVFRAICSALNLSDFESVWKASEKARIPTHMTFGKHKGLPVGEVPSDYVDWLKRQPDIDPYLMKAFKR